MGFFNKLKRNVQQEMKKMNTPEGCVNWQGWNVPLYKDNDSLSDDINTLRKMLMYYLSPACTDVSNKDRIVKEIVLKANELVKNGAVEEYEWVSRQMVDLFGTQEEKAAFAFGYQLRRLKKSHFTMEDVTLRNTKKGAEKDELVNKRAFDTEYPMIDKLPEYYEAHLEELIHVVWELIEEEKQDKSILYIGLYLYDDLMHFVEMKKKDAKYPFSNKVWKETYAYLDLANKEFDIHRDPEAMKRYKNFDLSYIPDLNYKQTYAIRKLGKLNDNKLLKEWQSYKSASLEKNKKPVVKEAIVNKQEEKVIVKEEIVDKVEEKPIVEEVIVNKQEEKPVVKETYVNKSKENVYVISNTKKKLKKRINHDIEKKENHISKESVVYNQLIKDVNGFILDVEKYGHHDKVDKAMTLLDVLGEVQYYEKMRSVLTGVADRILNSKPDAKMNEVEKYLYAKYECGVCIKKLNECFEKLTQEEVSFLQTNKEKKVSAILDLMNKTEEEKLLSAFTTLEEYNSVLKDKDLYMNMATYAYECLKANKEDTSCYEQKYLSYLNKAILCDHYEAQDALDHYTTFKEDEENEEAFAMALDIFENKKSSLKQYKVATRLIDSILSTKESIYVLEKAMAGLKNAYHKLSDRNEDYSFIYDKIITYYKKMDALGVEDANDDLNYFITYVKTQESFNEILDLTDQLYHQKFNDDEFIETIQRIVTLNDLCQTTGIYMDCAEFIEERMKDASANEVLNNLYISCLQKEVALGNEEAKDKLEEVGNRKKEDPLQEAKDILTQLQSYPLMQENVLPYLEVFKKSKNADLLYDFSLELKVCLENGDVFEQAYEETLKESAQLGCYDAYIDLGCEYGFEKYKSIAAQFESDKVEGVDYSDKIEKAAAMIDECYVVGLGVNNLGYYMRTLEDAKDGNCFFHFANAVREDDTSNYPECEELAKKCYARAYELKCDEEIMQALNAILYPKQEKKEIVTAQEKNQETCKQILKMCEMYGFMRLDYIEKFTSLFEEAADKELWKKYAEYCKFGIHEKEEYKKAYEYAMKKIKELK